jgi:hypothetical protein
MFWALVFRVFAEGMALPEFICPLGMLWHDLVLVDWCLLNDQPGAGFPNLCPMKIGNQELIVADAQVPVPHILFSIARHRSVSPLSMSFTPHQSSSTFWP